nr:integrase, catalytic region, zinc finger, CCHC-type, peptidase aspartic, catalytic [Tanacetum cinerariifolium]
MVIMKLKERIKSISGNLKEEMIKQELKEIETINIELDHRVTKLVTKNEHFLQEKVLVITALNDTLKKLKGKAVVDEAVTLHPIDPELLKTDVAPLAPKLRNNRTSHYDYLKHTQEETATFREIVENERLLNLLNTSLDYACIDLLIGSQGNNLYTMSLEDMMASSLICLLSKASKTKSWLWHRRLSHLNFGAINHLARQGLVRGRDCGYRMLHPNQSIIRLHHGKTPYDLLYDKLPDLSFLHVFGAFRYPTNDRPALHEMTPATISLVLVPKPTSSTPFVPPFRNEWDLLFQLLFDELLAPTPSVDPSAPEVIAPLAKVIPPEHAESTSSPSSTTVDQDAPSPSKSPTTPETRPPIIPNDVEEDNHDIEVAHMGNDPLF